MQSLEYFNLKGSKRSRNAVVVSTFGLHSLIGAVRVLVFHTVLWPDSHLLMNPDPVIIRYVGVACQCE